VVDERRLAPWAAMRAVFWSFFGVRRRKDYADDLGRITPWQFIFAALIGVAVFIGTVLTVVSLVVS
jgi:hypothetical protein